MIRPLSGVHLNLLSFLTQTTPPEVTLPSVARMRRCKTSRVSSEVRLSFVFSFGTLLLGSLLPVNEDTFSGLGQLTWIIGRQR